MGRKPRLKLTHYPARPEGRELAAPICSEQFPKTWSGDFGAIFIRFQDLAEDLWYLLPRRRRQNIRRVLQPSWLKS